MCDVPEFSEENLDYLLHKHRLHGITSFLIGVYFSTARVTQVKAPTDPLCLDGYTAQLCECRLDNQNCDNRIDTCFVKKGPAVEARPSPLNPSQKCARNQCSINWPANRKGW